MLIFFTIVVPLAMLTPDRPPLFLLPLFVAIIGWQWWLLLTLAYRVIVHDDGRLEWVALARRVTLLPEDVREIGPEAKGGLGFFRVVHRGGKVRFINQITGFHEVILHIKTRHPGVVLLGC